MNAIGAAMAGALVLVCLVGSVGLLVFWAWGIWGRDTDGPHIG